MGYLDLVENYVKECNETRETIEVQRKNYFNGPAPTFKTTTSIARFRKYTGLGFVNFSAEFHKFGKYKLSPAQIQDYEKVYGDNKVSQNKRSYQTRYIKRFIKIANQMMLYADSLGYRLDVATLVKERYNVDLDSIDS